MEVSASVAAAVTKARTSWLKNSEVLELLEGYEAAGLTVCQEPPMRPAGGQLFLFDRRICRFFRRDGHTWKKKPDGKTIRETHEKLKVGNAETLNCYYAHADQDDGLQRRCYWQLDPDKEHIVLVHYLCCASSRVGSQRGGAAEAREEGERRPQRASRTHGRRAYSPSPARRRGLAQPKLSPMATSSSLSSEVLEGGVSREPSVVGLPPMSLALDAAALPPMPAPHPPFALPQQGVALAPPPPPFLQPAAPPQQYAAPAAGGMQQQYTVVQQQFAPPAQQFSSAQLQLLAGRSSSLVSAASGASGEPDPFALGAAADLQRPHAGVLYTDQRVATQLASVQQPAVSAPLQPAISAPAHSAALPPRPLLQQESFTAEQHRGLFREMSLGIQKESAEDGFFLGSPTAEADALAGDKAAVGAPTGDLAALLASPPHGGAHRRSFSRQGSGLSRLISKNWESDVMEMMLPDVDADISAYPVGPGLVVEVAERPTSPSSRLFDQAGIAFFGSAQGSGSLAAAAAAAVQSALEPSPLGAPPLSPAPALTLGRGDAEAARQLPFASPAPLGASPPSELQFAAGDAHALAQRAAVHSRLQRSSGGVPRSGSHTHLALLGKRPGGAAEAASEEERRKERVDAAASAAASMAQEHRHEKLAAARGMRLAATSSGEGEEEAAEMIDVPENMQRLTSFLRGGVGGSSGGRLTMGRELAAAEAAAVADLELEARSLLKHMSIDEVDAVAAVRDATKELEVMPTIWAGPSSDADAASQLSEELASSRNQSVSSLLEGMNVNVSVNGGAPLDPVAEQLQAAMARHAARQAR